MPTVAGQREVVSMFGAISHRARIRQGARRHATSLRPFACMGAAIVSLIAAVAFGLALWSSSPDVRLIGRRRFTKPP